MPRSQSGERLPRQVLEVSRLTKKIGFIGGDCVNQVRQFLFPIGRGESILAVLPAGREIQAAQPAPKPRFQHDLLVSTQIAGLPIYQVAKPAEVGI
jgi:hypothetical protein